MIGPFFRTIQQQSDQSRRRREATICIITQAMSDVGRKRGADEDTGFSSLDSSGPLGASGAAGALSSSSISAKKPRQPSGQQDEATSNTSSSNGHPSAIIAPRCTFGTRDSKECPHIMVSCFISREPPFNAACSSRRRLPMACRQTAIQQQRQQQQQQQQQQRAFKSNT